MVRAGALDRAFLLFRYKSDDDDEVMMMIVIFRYDRDVAHNSQPHRPHTTVHIKWRRKPSGNEIRQLSEQTRSKGKKQQVFLKRMRMNISLENATLCRWMEKTTIKSVTRKQGG